MTLRIRRRAKKELLSIDDDGQFFAIVKAILDLEANPSPRGYDKVGRDWRVLHSINRDRDELIIEAVRKKDGRTYRR